MPAAGTRPGTTQLPLLSSEVDSWGNLSPNTPRCRRPQLKQSAICCHFTYFSFGRNDLCKRNCWQTVWFLYHSSYKPPAILHSEGGTFISSAVFSAKQNALGPDGKIFLMGIIQISSVFLRHFPAAFSQRQLFQTHTRFMCTGRGLPEFERMAAAMGLVH